MGERDRRLADRPVQLHRPLGDLGRQAARQLVGLVQVDVEERDADPQRADDLDVSRRRLARLGSAPRPRLELEQSTPAGGIGREAERPGRVGQRFAARQVEQQVGAPAARRRRSARAARSAARRRSARRGRGRSARWSCRTARRRSSSASGPASARAASSKRSNIADAAIVERRQVGASAPAARRRARSRERSSSNATSAAGSGAAPAPARRAELEIGARSAGPAAGRAAGRCRSCRLGAGRRRRASRSAATLTSPSCARRRDARRCPRPRRRDGRAPSR